MPPQEQWIASMTAAGATFPLLILQIEGETVGIVQDTAPAVLPFAEGSYTYERVESAEEAAAILGNSSPARASTCIGRFCARVDFAFLRTAQRHGLLLRQKANGACFTHLADGSIADMHAALNAALTQGDLWTIAADDSAVTVYVSLMSVPASSATISTSLEDIPRALLPHQEGAFTTRVILGDNPSHMIAALRRLFTQLLVDGDDDLRGTEVCWPVELLYPVNVHTREETRRRAEHAALLLPNQKACLHHDMAIESWLDLTDLTKGRGTSTGKSFRTGESWERHLVQGPHAELQSSAVPALPGAETLVTSGLYDYYHYRVDGFRDDGWGCAYRSLQTVLSWFQHAGLIAQPMPSIRRIQEILYRVDPDKENKKDFVGSNDWIGSFEIMLVLQHYLPGLDCTLKRLESGKDLDSDPSVQLLLSEHFHRPCAAPVMIGGSSYAHTILGIHVNVKTMEARYLILDPHYSANPTQLKTAIKKGYVGWKEASKFFEPGSWYNVCIPRVDLYDPR